MTLQDNTMTDNLVQNGRHYKTKQEKATLDKTIWQPCKSDKCKHNYQRTPFKYFFCFHKVKPFLVSRMELFANNWYIITPSVITSPWLSLNSSSKHESMKLWLLCQVNAILNYLENFILDSVLQFPFQYHPSPTPTPTPSSISYFDLNFTCFYNSNCCVCNFTFRCGKGRNTLPFSSSPILPSWCVFVVNFVVLLVVVVIVLVVEVMIGVVFVAVVFVVFVIFLFVVVVVVVVFVVLVVVVRVWDWLWNK